MSSKVPEQGASPTKGRFLLYFIAFAVGVLALLALVTAPVAHLLGDSEYAIPASLHGVASIVYVIIAVVLAYMGLQLYLGKLVSYHDLRILSGLGAFFSTLTILFGNWIYIAYRAKSGPRTYFLETSPAIHEVFFEFKEFLALFTLPLSVGSAFVIWHEREALAHQATLRRAVGIALILATLYLLVTFGLGAAITKLRSV